MTPPAETSERVSGRWRWGRLRDDCGIGALNHSLAVGTTTVDAKKAPKFAVLSVRGTWGGDGGTPRGRSPDGGDTSPRSRRLFRAATRASAGRAGTRASR